MMVDGSTLTSPHLDRTAATPLAQATRIAPNQPIPPTAKQPAVHLSRAQILHATAVCLAECGYDGTTIRRIAKQLNCAVGSIYRYFDDKRSLLDAVTQARFEPVAQVAEVSAERSAALYAHAAADEPQQYRLMFWLASVGRAGGKGGEAGGSGDPGNPGSKRVPGVPDVVRRIISAWEKQMGDRRKAERFWAQLHGRIMLGEVGPGATQSS